MKIPAPRSVSNRPRHCRRLQKLFIALSNVISQEELESLSICIFFFNIAKSHSLRHCENAKALMSQSEIMNSTYFHGWPISILPYALFHLFSYFLLLSPNRVSESDKKKFYLFLKQGSGVIMFPWKYLVLILLIFTYPISCYLSDLILDIFVNTSQIVYIFVSF